MFSVATRVRKIAQVERLRHQYVESILRAVLHENCAENIVTGSAKRVVHSVLFVCVMFAQQGMATHALSHLKSIGDHRIQVSNPAAPANSPCEQCLAFQGVGSGLTGSDGVPAAVQPVAASISVSVGDFIPFLGAPFNSRAPPFLLR